MSEEGTPHSSLPNPPPPSSTYTHQEVYVYCDTIIPRKEFFPDTINQASMVLKTTFEMSSLFTYNL